MLSKSNWIGCSNVQCSIALRDIVKFVRSTCVSYFIYKYTLYVCTCFRLLCEWVNEAYRVSSDSIYRIAWEKTLLLYASVCVAILVVRDLDWVNEIHNINGADKRDRWMEETWKFPLMYAKHTKPIPTIRGIHSNLGISSLLNIFTQHWVFINRNWYTNWSVLVFFISIKSLVFSLSIQCA